MVINISPDAGFSDSINKWYHRVLIIFWLGSFSLSSRSFHNVTCGRISSFLVAEWESTFYPFIPWWILRLLPFFLVIVKNNVMSIDISSVLFSFPLGVYPEMGLLDHIAVLKTSSKMVGTRGCWTKEKRLFRGTNVQLLDRSWTCNTQYRIIDTSTVL